MYRKSESFDGDDYGSGTGGGGDERERGTAKYAAPRRSRLISPLISVIWRGRYDRRGKHRRAQNVELFRKPDDFQPRDRAAFQVSLESLLPKLVALPANLISRDRARRITLPARARASFLLLHRRTEKESILRA